MSAENVKLGIVVARFNSFITQRLLDGALAAVRRFGGDPDGVDVAHVPGSFELGVTAKRMAQTGRYHAIVCLGCVIQGETAHYDCVVQGATMGISQAAMDTGVPVIFGVLTCGSQDQAIDRAGGKMGNAGAGAAEAAIEMSQVIRQIEAGQS